MRPGTRRVVALALSACVAGTIAAVGGIVRPASAAGPLSITVSSAPASVATGQALAYTITVTDTAAVPATSLTVSDSLNGLVPGNGQTTPAIETNVGSCTFASPQMTCSAASLSPGQVWTTTVTEQVTAASGSTMSDTATVSGTESAATVTASATTTVAVSQSLPSGFVQTKLASGLSKPIAVDFAPGGDVYIAEQTGTVVRYHNGAVVPTPVLTLSVFNVGETGLLGIALDPNFATNGYLYVSYTLPVTVAGVVKGYAQLSRFTVVNGVASTSSEKIYFRGNQAQNQDGSGPNYDHAGNDVKIGPDGKLWWSVGDNVPAISNGQTLGNIYGKILRFNLDGTVPADNPFVSVPGAVPYIYAYGLRNPWRFTFLPTGQAMTEDTGSSYWEDLDTIVAGGNYGWPVKEGNCGSCGYLNPAFAYGHLPVDAATSAIAAYSGSRFPQAYGHVVFLGDYNRKDIEAVTFDPTYRTEVSDTVFDSTAGTIADLQEGPDGNLYFVSVFEGTFSEISAPGPFAPAAAAAVSPNAGTGPLTVQFSSAGSADPYGLALGYSWNFGDGSPSSTAADPTHTYSVDGTYTATLTVSNGATTAQSSTTVVVGESPPTATITAPTSYNAGDTVAFSGTATDAVDGTLPGYAYSWKVDFYSNGVLQPSYFAEVPTPFDGPVSGSSGSFQVPTDPSQVPGSFYRITLTVTDSLGLTTVLTQDLHPNLTTWSVAPAVLGAGYFVDGAWETAPSSTTDVVGVRHVLTGLPLAQSVGSVRYRFSGWADGSALTDTFTAGTAPATYTAEFDPVQSTMPAPWSSADIGAPITAGTADYAPSDQAFSVDGAGADAYGANDQFHYVYQTLPGDGTIVARVRLQSAASTWSKAGVMIKQSATAGAPFVDALVAPDVSPATPNTNGVGCTANGCLAPLPPVTPAMGYGARMQYSGSHSSTPKSYPAGFAEPNKWLKLQRAGNTFTSWISSDGVHWTQMGIATVAMTGPVTIGLFVTSRNIGAVSTAAFDNVQVTAVTPPPPPGPLPTPWTDTDVGAPALAGSAGYANGVFTVHGAGADIYGTNDQFHYVDQPVTTSGTIVARVTSQTNTSSNAKAGVMFKQSTTAGSSYFLIAVGPAGNIKVQYNFNSSTGGATYTFPNVWMKLTWSGTKFTAWTSPDGATWTQVLSKTITMTSPATVGLFVCSHNTSALGTATFDNVSFTSP